MRVIVIMAGGSGERFWPLSRRLNPKQLLPLAGERAMVVETVERARTLVPPERIYIVAGNHLMAKMRDALPVLPPENFLVEPVPKNTAPCLAFAAGIIARRHGEDSVMGVLSADSLVRDQAAFASNADLAFAHAERNDVLLALGVRPAHPDTGFGYLELGSKVFCDERGSVYAVAAFREKPDSATAAEYVKSGRFLWNSGMFFWKVSSLMAAFDTHCPEFAAGVRRIARAGSPEDSERIVAEVFESLPAISIDYAVMERAGNVHTVAGTFDWDDVGTWNALIRTQPLDEAGNAKRGDAIALETSDSILYNAAPSGKEKVLVTYGVGNLIVVVTDDAVMVCDRDKGQDIKKILKYLKENGYEGFC